MQTVRMFILMDIELRREGLRLGQIARVVVEVIEEAEERDEGGILFKDRTWGERHCVKYLLEK